MTDDAANIQLTGARMNVLGQYVRRVSFTNIAAQQGVAAPGGKPNISVQVRVDSAPLSDTRHQVALGTTCKATSGETEVFELDLDYVGMFELTNVPDASMPLALSIECPRLLFPFARRIIAELTRDGGFPPLLLDPIDFRALYLKQAQQAATTAAKAANGGGLDA